MLCEIIPFPTHAVDVYNEAYVKKWWALIYLACFMQSCYNPLLI
jgi:hypothetical protein